MFHLSKDALKRHLLDDLWKAKAATSPRSLASVVTSDVVLEAIRKELRRQTSYNCDVAEIKRAIESDVLRPDLATS